MCRIASHSGSWYSSHTSELNQQLEQWLANVEEATGDDTVPDHGIRAIIAPGQAAAYAYKCLKADSIQRVFILGPSHHIYMSDCAVSGHTNYDTPLGTLKLDTEVIRDLQASGDFSVMPRQVDEDEHSIEMHLPYLYKMLAACHRETTVRVVPILVGNLDPEAEARYGRLLAPYLADPANFFIISSDFCHWGTRFRYTFYSPDDQPSSSPGRAQQYKDFHLPIYRSIENLDREGMRAVETLDPSRFYKYLEATDNTICGRHPILVLMHAIRNLPQSGNGGRPQLRFVYYAQSSQVRSIHDSSVSYASAYLQIEP
ncbi:hypothetical protein IWQ60_010561 [Tieghemiomyces parasiticus]|uniref:Protein MEMO1 n=1 Tax=Tieghemiomyces parasiticus TaxID=78921 RepID=A0A9W7ZJG1_9FUNG|nr:hypothetical protein IWQ60_010561 [Tieghemiomyces parasiticus]